MVRYLKVIVFNYLKMGKIIAIDLGGTNLRVSLVKGNKILKYIKKETPKTGKELIKVLFENIGHLMDKDVIGIGVSSAGPLINGIIKNPPNLPLKNFNLKKALEKKFKKRVEVENDAACVALAETKLGCKKRNFFILTIGTGIGGGIIINGELYNGEGYGGELGHTILDNGKDFEILWKENKKSISKYFGKNSLVNDLIKIKNKKSNAILEKISDDFGKAIGSLINVFDPEIVILSGGIKETGKTFLNKIKKKTKKYVILPKDIKISWTKLEHPGTLGASLLIQKK